MPQQILLTCGRGERDTNCMGRFPPARTVRKKINYSKPRLTMQHVMTNCAANREAAESAGSVRNPNRSLLSLIDAAIRLSLAIIRNDRLGELLLAAIQCETWQQRPSTTPAAGKS